MKKFILPLILSSILLVGCSGGENPSTSNSGASSATTATTQVPQDPVLRFLNAKKSTYENTTYEYNYVANASIKFKGALDFSPAKIEGKVQWNKNAPSTQYMSTRTLSGLLLIDSTSYKYNVGNDLIKLNADENKDFSIVNYETISQGYDFETNSIGRLLRLIDDNGLLKVTKENSKYKLDLKPNFANDSFLGVLNYIDSQKIINTMSTIAEKKWNVSFGYDCYATLTQDETKVNSFHFSASVNVKDIVDISFSFDQTFSSYEGGFDIVLPHYANTYTLSNEIDAQLATLRSNFDIAKEKYYKYDLKTKVDHGVSKENPLGMGVDSHSQGYAERAHIGSDIFFHNGLELDSDYKNKDQYPDICDDYKFTRAKVNNGSKEVYDVKDGIKNTYNLIDGYNNDEVDDYYMLINKDWLSSSIAKILRKTTDKDSNIIYKLCLGEEGISSIFNHYNKHTRLSPDSKKEHINVFKVHDGLNTKKADFIIKTKPTGEIIDINLELKGFYNMDVNDDVKFKLNLNIKFDYEHESYSVPTSKEDIKLPNF